MKTKAFSLMNAVLMVFLLCFAVSCEPTVLPGSGAVLESISITPPTVKDENRVITDKVGEFSYADKAEATIRMTFKDAEPAEKDSVITIDLVSKVTWSTTVSKTTFTGDLVLTPTLTGTDKITVKYGTLEVTDLFTVSNTTFDVTVSGISAEMPFFGFNKVEAVGDATNKVTYVTENGKYLAINTLTQAFKLSHSDGTSKDIEVTVLEAVKDISGAERMLVGYEEVSRKVSDDFQYTTYVIRHHYNVGEPVDREVKVYSGIYTSGSFYLSGLHFLERDWTLAKFEQVSYKINQEQTFYFEDAYIHWVSTDYEYEFLFLKEFSQNLRSHMIRCAEMSYVCGELPPLTLSSPVFTATVDVILGDYMGEYDSWERYYATYRMDLACDGVLFKRITSGNSDIYIKKGQ